MSRDANHSPSPTDNSLRTPPGSPGRPSAFHAATPHNSPQRPELMSLIPPSINTQVGRTLILPEADLDASPLSPTAENPDRRVLLSPKAGDPKDVVISPPPRPRASTPGLAELAKTLELPSTKISTPAPTTSSPLPRRASTPGLAQLLAETGTMPRRKRSYATLPPIIESDEPPPEIKTSNERAIRKIPAPISEYDSIAEVVRRGAEPRSSVFYLDNVNPHVKEHLTNAFFPLPPREYLKEMSALKKLLIPYEMEDLSPEKDIMKWKI